MHWRSLGENPTSCNCCLKCEAVLQNAISVIIVTHSHNNAGHLFGFRYIKKTSRVSSIRGLPSCWGKKIDTSVPGLPNVSSIQVLHISEAEGKGDDMAIFVICDL